MELRRRTPEETKAWTDGYNYALKMAVYRLETANDETDRICLIEAIKEMTLLTEVQQP